jgi:hypothetical protein
LPRRRSANPSPAALRMRALRERRKAGIVTPPKRHEPVTLNVPSSDSSGVSDANEPNVLSVERSGTFAQSAEPSPIEQMRGPSAEGIDLTPVPASWLTESDPAPAPTILGTSVYPKKGGTCRICKRTVAQGTADAHWHAHQAEGWTAEPPREGGAFGFGGHSGRFRKAPPPKPEQTPRPRETWGGLYSERKAPTLPPKIESSPASPVEGAKRAGSRVLFFGGP